MQGHCTPLHVAVKRGHVGAVEKLLNHGADVNEVDLVSPFELHCSEAANR
jgi:ankyrin repeat protein